MTVDGGGETGDGRKPAEWWKLRRFEALTGRIDAGGSKAEIQKPAGSKTKYEMGEGRVGVTGCNQGTGYAEGMDVTDQMVGGRRVLDECE
jgi:hypothetical protein